MNSRRQTVGFSRCDIAPRRVNAGITEFVDVIAIRGFLTQAVPPKGETVIVRRFIVLLTLSAMTAMCAEATAQSTFPAPLPNQLGEAPAPALPLGSPDAIFPAPGFAQKQEECWTTIPSLRQDAEKRAQAIKAANDRKATPQEECRLLKSYVQATAKLLDFVSTRRAACGVPTNIVRQLEDNQARSQLLMKGGLCRG